MDIQKVWVDGYGLSMRTDKRGKVVAVKDASVLTFPIIAIPNAVYSFSVEANCESGNGILYCNIQNDGYDFMPVKVICNKPDWNFYSFEASTGKLKGSVCLLRFWREPDGKGVLLLRSFDIGFLTSESIQKKNIEKKKYIETLKSNPESLYPTASVAPCRCLKSAGNVELFTNKTPIRTQTIINETGIKVSVVISTFNRKDFLARSFLTYDKQTLNKKEFELVIVDDGSTEDIKGLCKREAQNLGLQIQYILINKYKGAYVPRSFNQALTNNIGFKQARGPVIVITGPETLQRETNLELSWKIASGGFCVYGDVLRSSTDFMDIIKSVPNWHKMSFDDVVEWESATQDTDHCKGFWWYYVAVKKEFIMAIGGVDERFMEGITAEDDNFAFRLNAFGVPLIRDQEIIGIHQNHTREDGNDLHAVRSKNPNTWTFLRNHNINLLNSWWRTENPVANQGIDWGTNDAIIEKEIF